MLAQAAAIEMIAVGDSFGVWALAAVLLGAGTAAVYPMLLASISDAVQFPLAGPRRRRLPALARRRVRRRRATRRHPRRRLDRRRPQPGYAASGFDGAGVVLTPT